MNPKSKCPLVSIITPVYNGEKFIEDMIRSVICQKYKNIEHIIIDDGSNDNTASIIKKYEKMYNLKWFSKINEGQTITLNKCIDIAQGDFIVILNADDALFDRNVITNIVQYMKKNLDIDVVYGHMAIIDGKNRLLRIQYAIPMFSFERLLQYHFAYFICYRVNVFSNYRFNPTLNYTMDYEHALRLAKNGIKFGCLKKILYTYRIHESTKSMSKRKDQIDETKKVQKLYGKKFTWTGLITKLSDSLIIIFLKFSGLKTVSELLSSSDKYMLAFPLRFGSIFKTLVGQIVPFLTVKM